MAAGSNTSMGDRQLWSSWAAKQSLKYSDSNSEENKDDDDSKMIQASSGENKYSVSMKLPRKDMSIFGLRPASEDLILVVCALCNLHVKQQNFIYHRNNHHKEASDDAFINHISKHSVPRNLANKSVSSQSAKNAFNSDTQCSRTSNSNNNSFCGASTTTSSSSGTHRTQAASTQGLPGSDSKSYVKATLLRGDGSNSFINSKLPSSQQVIQNSVLSSSNFSSNGQPTVELEQLPFDTSSIVQNNEVKKRKGRDYDPDRHCGVPGDTGQPCTRSLLHTCKGHKIALRQQVPGRSKDYKTVLKELQKKSRHPKQQSACQDELSVVPENMVHLSQTNNVPVIEILKVNTKQSNHAPCSSPLQITADTKPRSWGELGTSSNRNELFTESPHSPLQPKKEFPSNLKRIKYDVCSHDISDVPVPVKVTLPMPSTSVYAPVPEVLVKKEFNLACYNQRNNQKLISQPCSPLQDTVLAATPKVPAHVSSTVVTMVDGKSQQKFNSTRTGILRGLPNLKDLSNCGFLRDSNDGDTGSDSTPVVAKRRPKPVSICTFGLRFVSKGMYTTCPKIRHIHTAFRNTAQKKCADPEPKLTENPVGKHQYGSDPLEHHITSSSFVAPSKALGVENSGEIQTSNAWPLYYKVPPNQIANQTPGNESTVTMRRYPFTNWGYSQKNGMGVIDTSRSRVKSEEGDRVLNPSIFTKQTSQPILTHAYSNTNEGQPHKRKRTEGIWNPALPGNTSNFAFAKTVLQDTSAHPGKETITNSLPESVLCLLPLQTPTSHHGQSEIVLNDGRLINFVLTGDSNTSAVVVPSQSSAVQGVSAPFLNGNGPCISQSNSVSDCASSSGLHLQQRDSSLNNRRICSPGNSNSQSENECPRASSPVLAVQTPVSSSHTTSFQLSLGLKRPLGNVATRPLGNAVMTASKINQPVTTLKSILVSSAAVANDKQCRPKHVARILPKDSPTAISLNRLVGTSCQILQLPSDILCKNGISSGDTSISFR